MARIRRPNRQGQDGISKGVGLAQAVGGLLSGNPAGLLAVPGGLSSAQGGTNPGLQKAAGIAGAAGSVMDAKNSIRGLAEKPVEGSKMARMIDRNSADAIDGPIDVSASPQLKNAPPPVVNTFQTLANAEWELNQIQKTKPQLYEELAPTFLEGVSQLYSRYLAGDPIVLGGQYNV